MAKSKKYIYAVGRRRRASARIRLFKGKGQTMVNEMPIGKYFSVVGMDVSWRAPFELTETTGKYFATIKVVGGGRKGQLGAVVHGLARALSEANEAKFRAPLKKAGLLTRDARKRQRRMVGTGGKARRKKQSPKR